MGYKLFVDSDVVIDYFTDRAPHANSASELFELMNKDILNYISLQSVSIIFITS